LRFRLELGRHVVIEGQGVRIFWCCYLDIMMSKHHSGRRRRNGRRD
jgi:hypothetical protein